MNKADGRRRQAYKPCPKLTLPALHDQGHVLESAEPFESKGM